VDLLSRDQIEAALAALDAELGRCGVRAEVYLVGGALPVRTRLILEEMFDDGS
jgi:hypothetical protein